MKPKLRLSPFHFNPAAHTAWSDAVREHEAGIGEPLAIMLRDATGTIPESARQYLAGLAEATAKRPQGRPIDPTEAVDRLYRNRRILTKFNAYKGVSRADAVAQIAEAEGVSEKTVEGVITAARKSSGADEESPT